MQIERVTLGSAEWTFHLLQGQKTPNQFFSFFFPHNSSATKQTIKMKMQIEKGEERKRESYSIDYIFLGWVMRDEARLKSKSPKQNKEGNKKSWDSGKQKQRQWQWSRGGCCHGVWAVSVTSHHTLSSTDSPTTRSSHRHMSPYYYYRSYPVLYHIQQIL